MGSIDSSARNYAAVAECETEEEFNDSYEDAFTFSSTNSAKQIVSPVQKRKRQRSQAGVYALRLTLLAGCDRLI